MFKRIIFFLILSLSFISLRSATTINAQCVTGNVTGEWLGTADGRQTFSPTISGTLYKVRVHTATYGSSTNITVRIMSGSPGSGSVLTSLTYFKGANLNSWDDVVFPGNGIPVTATSPYYIEIAVGSQVDWIKSSTNVYAGGSAWRGMTNYNNNDYNFEVHLAVAACATLTPGPNQTGIIANTASSTLALNAGGDPGNWTSSGGGVFADPHNPNSTYTPSCSEAGSTTTLTWTSSCNLSSVTQTISVTPPSLTVNNAAICPGGLATLSASGAVSYAWSANAGGSTLASVNVTPGTTTTYTVTGTLSNGCVTSLNPVVTVYPLPSANTGADVTVCDGTPVNFTVTPSGGTPGYSYEWYNVPTGGTALTTSQVYTPPGSGAGVFTYYGLVKDANNCISPRDPVQLTVNPRPTMSSVSKIDITCFGANNGQLIGNATGGSAPYQYSFTGIAPFYSNPITNLSSGSYTLYANDANGCTSSNWMSNSINEPPPINLTPSSSNISCFGAADGSASITASGGVGGFSYSWSPSGGTASTASPLAAGSYTCNVTDANSCPASYTFAITQPAALIASSGGLVNVTCSSGSNGSATVSASGGTGGYSYSWAPFGGVAATATGLIAGNYTCTVNDANACTAAQVFTINQPLNVTISANTQTNILCNGAATGVVSVNGATGGSGAGYQYSLNGGTFGGSPSFTGLTAGSYTVTARDNNLCPSNSVVFTLTQPSAITLGTSGNSAPCSATALSVTLTGSGGVAGYTYSWKASADNVNTTGENFSAFTNTNLINNVITNLTTAAEVVSYSVNVTDANGCVANFSVPTTIAPAPTLLPISNQVLCAGASSAAIAFTSSIGGSTINWTNSSPSIGIAGSGTTNIAATPMVNVGATPVVGNFSATANFSGCTGPAQTFNITVNPLPSLTSSAAPSTICEGGTSAFSVSGADTYNWNPAAFLSSPTASNPTFNGSSAGAYTYTVTGTVSATGCSNISIVNINVNPTPVLPTLTSNSPVCAGGTLNLGTPAAATTYAWTGPNTFSSNVQNPSIAGVSAAGTGTYSLTITSGGCSSAIATIGVIVNAAPTIAAAGADQNVCATTATLNANAPTIGTGTWTVISGSGVVTTPSSPTSGVTGLTSGINTFRWTISNGACTSSFDEISINRSLMPTTSAAGGDQNLCNLTISTLGANSPTIGIGAWSVISGSAVVTTPTSPTSGVTGLTIGASSTLRWTITNGSCPASTDDIIITSNPNPTIGGSLTACTGNTSALTGTGTTSSWSSSNTSVATVNATSGLVTAIAPGNTNINYLNTDGCSTVAVYTVIATPATPVIGSNSPVCTGNTLNLTTSLVAGATYSWTGPNAFSSSSQNPSIVGATVAASGNYTLTTTVNGCTSLPGTGAIAVNALPTATISYPGTPYCAVGSAAVTQGGQGGGTYSSSAGLVINSTTGLIDLALSTPGAYTVTYSFSDGTCSSTTTTPVTINAIPAAPIAGSNSPVCTGNSINLTATLVGGTYSWTGPSAFSSSLQNPTRPGASVLMAGTYSVTVTSGGCTSAIATTNVIVNTTPASPTLSSNSPVCAGGTLNLTTPAIGTYNWTGPNAFSSPLQNPTIPAVTGAGSGTYSLTITSGGCTSAIATTAVTINATPAAPALTSNSPICVGGTLNLNTPAIGTYNWSGPNGFTSTLQNPIIAGITAAANGTYSLTVTSSGCSSPLATTNVTVNNPPTASITAGGPLTFCSGNTVTFTASPNTGVSYQWKHGVTNVGTNSSTYTTGNAGNHTVIVTDLITGCIDTSNMLNVNVDALPSGTASITNTSCFGLSNGSVTVTPSGTGPFNYSYNGGAYIATASQTNLSVGNYTVNVQDGLGCISPNILYSINQPSAISFSGGSVNGVNCNGGNDGSITAFAPTGGTGAFTYDWTPGAPIGDGTLTITNLTAANYSLTATDVNGCNNMTSFTVNQPSAISINLIPSNVTCFGGNNGSITATASGGTGSTYQYSLDNVTFQASGSFTGLAAGAYTVYARDLGLCTFSNTTSISQPASGFLVSSSNSTNICSGQAWGETFSSSGGFGTITYSWVAQPPTNVTGASSGSGNTIGEILTATTFDPYTPETVIYDLYATDQNGCNATSTFTVYVNPLPIISLSSDVNPLCISSVANLTATSTSDFFGWVPITDLTIVNSSSATFTPSTTGNIAVTYTVAMNTGANCTNTGVITLTVTPSPTAPILASNSPICAGSSINLTSNTIAGATYTWNGPNGFTSSLEDPSILVATLADAGTYTCTVNVGGCTSSSTINVGVNPKPQAIIPGASTNFCTNATFTLDGSSSIANSTSIINYQWQLGGINVGINLPTYTGNTPGNYSLIVTNDLGCTDMTLTPNIVTANAAPTPIITGTTTFCSGANTTLDGSSSTAGGSATITNYEWFFNGASLSFGSTFVASTGGNYQLVTTNSNSCIDTSTITVVNEIAPLAPPTFVSTASTFCAGDSVLLSISSVNGSSIYNWSALPSGAFNSFPTWADAYFSATTSGTYTVNATETDINGCISAPFSMILTVNAAPIATASFTSNDTICYNGNASVALNLITGGTYTWTTSTGSTSTSQSVTFNNITTAGNVQFYGTVTDAAGCASATDTLNLFVQNQPTAPVISNASSVCPGQGFTLNVNPIISGANYFWTDPSATTQNAIDLTSITIPVATAITAGPYVVYYIDPLGCTSATSALYNQPLDPTPIVSISGLTTICSGNSTTLNAGSSVGTPSSFQWYNNGTAIAGATTSTLNVTAPGNYNVQITLTTGCFDSAAVATNVNVSSGPTVLVNPTSSTICSGNSTTITASGALTYSWDNGATTVSTIVNPTITTSYIVTGTDANGCTNKDTAVVIVNALPATPVITAGSTTECAETNVALGSNATITATWINTSTLAVIGTTQNISHTETVAGTYNYGIYVTDANSCNSATATIAVTFNSCLTNLISDNANTNANTPVSGNFLTNDGSPTIFTTVSIVNGPANGAITVSSNGNFTYTPNANFSGYNTIVVQVCDATPTCLNDTIYIVVNPNLVGDTYTVNGFTTPNSIIGNVLTNDAGSGISGNVVLVNSVSNGILVIDSLGNFNYTPNDGFCGNDLFTYSTCDQNGLCANAGVNLIVTCDSTIIPNTAFSPNGDNVNDDWVIPGIESTQNTVTVFDRWGNQVITITNYNNSSTTWNGKNSNGVELPAGTYFYSINVLNEKPKKGWVEITK